MELTIHTPTTAPEASRALLDGIAADIGVLPNLVAAVAESPALLTGFDGLRRAIAESTLPPIAREVAGLAVGVVVDNRYGVAFHSTVLGRHGVEAAEIERMRAGRPPSDPKLAAVYELAQRIVLDRGKVDTAAATAAGWTHEQILEIVGECAFVGLVGMIDNLAGRVALDDFLKPQEWAP